jgi:hypothetical protein
VNLEFTSFLKKELPYSETKKTQNSGIEFKQRGNLVSSGVKWPSTFNDQTIHPCTLCAALDRAAHSTAKDYFG